jgi:hypothetical protein
MGDGAGRCTFCGFEQLQEGWVTDYGGYKGFANWVAGALERGPLGGARKAGKIRQEIVAARCLRCSHLELFVRPPGP